MDRQQWLDRRRRYITATDATKILGTSPHGTEWDVWREKQGEDQDLGDIGVRGLELEPHIVGDAPVPLVAPWDPLITRDEWAAATVDRLTEAAGEPVELKTTNKRLGVDAPQHWIDQVLHQCYVTGAARGIIYAVSASEWVFDAIRAGNCDLRSALALRQARWHGWEIEAIDYTARAERLRAWHGRHVVGGEPPEKADGSDAARAWLATRADERTEEISADEPEIEWHARQYDHEREAERTHRDHAKDHAAQAAEHAARLIQILTDRGAKRAVSDGVQVTAVDSKGRRSLDRRALEEAHPDLVEKYTKTGAATVSVRVKIK